MQMHPIEWRAKPQPEESDKEYSMAQQRNFGVRGYAVVLQYIQFVYKVHLHPNRVAQFQY